MIAPLIWLLGFDLIVCVVWYVAFKVFELTGPPRLVQVMGAIVILINVVILLVWLLGVLGLAPSELMSGPHPRSR